MFLKSGYTAPTHEYFDSSEKVRFYTGLPSYDVLLIVFQHVAPHVPRRAKVLDSFQEFVMVLIKLRLNVPFQDFFFFIKCVQNFQFMDNCYGCQVVVLHQLAP